VVLVAGLIFLPAALFSQQISSAVRSVRLSSVSGTVTVKRPGATAGVPAQVNTPIEEGFEVSTAKMSGAAVQLENGSRIQLSPLSQALFTSLATDAEGNKQNGVTLEQGIATFYFIPERQDSYRVKIGNTTLTPQGKATFRATFSRGRMRVFVLSGSVGVSANSRMLTLGKGKAMEYTPLPAEEVAKYDRATAEQVATSHARVVRLSYVSGRVTMKRSTSPDWENAAVNTPIQEGFELSTSGDGFAEVEFENGSTARLGELSKLLFNQLALSDEGDKLNGMTVEQGYATFHFLPEPSDTYHVKVGDVTLTASGKSEFRTDLERDRFRVEVFNGSVNAATSTLPAKLGEGKVLERQSGSPELAFNIREGINKDAWDKWTEARDKQVQLTAKDEPVGPMGLRYGWSELDTYGEWVQVPGRGFGWSPYAQAGWSPYSSGTWQWYPGFGWVWISSEPWGWLPYHCGRWHHDPSFGWFWMMPWDGCLFWEGSLVDWYMGPGWIGWAPYQGGGQPGGSAPPSGNGGSGNPSPVHPSPPHPHPRPENGKSLVATRHVTTVPLSVFQNRQMITPETVKRTLVGADSRIDRPPFEPVAPPTPPATAPAAGGRSTWNSNATGAGGAPAPASIGKLGKGFAPHHSSAPPTILMGGDAKKESALLSGHHLRSRSEPLRARNGTTLGGRYAVRGSPGEFRGEAFKAEGASGAGAMRGSQGGPIAGRASGGGGAVVVSHGSGGGGGGGGGGGTHSGGGGGYSGGGGSGGGGHSGGGGGASAGGGGGAGHH
jgi:ferric-dicitrate binding protein FerR (iron transport regulator)